MDLFRAKAALCRLLSCNIDLLEFGDMRALVEKRRLLWGQERNPSNPEQYYEQLVELEEAWALFLASRTGEQGNSSKDPDPVIVSTPHLPKRPASDPEPDSDDPGWGKWDRRRRIRQEERREAERQAREQREPTPPYNEGPFDDSFFTPSPRRKFAVPDGMRDYFRSASNRRAGKFFALFCKARSLARVTPLYRRFSDRCLYFGAYCTRTDEDILCVLMLLDSEHRLADVKKECQKVGLSPLQAFYATKVQRCISFCREEFGEPAQEPVKYSPASTDSNSKRNINYKMLADFALAHNITEPLELMYDYAHLSTGCDLSVITNEHESEHAEHRENARIFEHFSDKKRIAKNAVESVLAKILVQSKRESNLQYLNRRCREIGDEIQDNFSTEDVGEAWLYCSEIVSDFQTVSKHILAAFVDGIPRQRFVVLRGTFRSGKTSLASAWCQLLEGTNINVNVDRRRLPFYLGQAIGKRFVLFDDVKGRPLEPGTLPHGTGFENLDDLRDHLDGHVEVQLEKKFRQPVSQIFPCGIITCNAYNIPPSLAERIVGPFDMSSSPLFQHHAARRVTEMMIFVGLALYNLLPVEPYVHEFLYTRKSRWESQHMMSDCGCLKFLRQKAQEQRESDQRLEPGPSGGRNEM